MSAIQKMIVKSNIYLIIIVFLLVSVVNNVRTVGLLSKNVETKSFTVCPLSSTSLMADFVSLFERPHSPHVSEVSTTSVSTKPASFL